MNCRTSKGILVWLPSPLGDAVLATPTLRALREYYRDHTIAFIATPTVRALLTPECFNDVWIDVPCRRLPIAAVRQTACDTAVLLKNSFGAALAVFTAGVRRRVGYARDARRVLLSDAIAVPRDTNGRYRPEPMIDYYLRLADYLGCATTDRQLQIPLDPAADLTLGGKLPALGRPDCPVVVFVCGGAFGPSKCWPADRFAQLADRLVQAFGATVVLLVAPNAAEQAIAQQIVHHATQPVINVGDSPLTIGEAKALIAQAELVVTNDTGPRHIAIALQRPVITLFGPNDPAWTQTGYADEVQIIGQAPCVPCEKPHCRRDQHLCMESITVDTVYSAAVAILERVRQ